MVPHHNAQYLADLVSELRQLPRETEWVEFKTNRADPQDIGEYISALANGAALNGKNAAHILWGIADGTHAVIGTDFKPEAAKTGNEPLENWLRRDLTPPLDFRFYEVAVDGKRVVILEIDPTTQQPAAFKGERFICVGSVKKNFREHPEKERALWQVFASSSFEAGVAEEHLTDDAVLCRLNYAAYFDLLQRPTPESINAILHELQSDRLIAPCAAGGWNITNLGAILFANRLNDFQRLERVAKLRNCW